MFFVFLLLSYAISALTASSDDWRSRSIYQVVVDRFAQTDGSTTATCNADDQIYCGGTWKGLINKLDYIQDMGFTAVSLQRPRVAMEAYIRTDLDIPSDPPNQCLLQ